MDTTEILEICFKCFKSSIYDSIDYNLNLHRTVYCRLTDKTIYNEIPSCDDMILPLTILNYYNLCDRFQELKQSMKAV